MHAPDEDGEAESEGDHQPPRSAVGERLRQHRSDPRAPEEEESQAAPKITDLVQESTQRFLRMQQVRHADHILVAGCGVDHVLADRFVLAGCYTVRRD